MSDENEGVRRTQAIRRALELATEALDVLDAQGGPPEAAVHLDLAIEALKQHYRNGG